VISQLVTWRFMILVALISCLNVDSKTVCAPANLRISIENFVKSRKKSISLNHCIEEIFATAISIAIIDGLLTIEIDGITPEVPASKWVGRLGRNDLRVDYDNVI